MSSNFSSAEFKKLFVFATIEDQPLLKNHESLTIIILSIIFLFVGVLFNARILILFTGRKNRKIIDKLIISNSVVSTIGHSLVLAYYIASNIVFPLSDYIGNIGCLASGHLMDTFIRFYNFCFPIAMALLRYLFVVKNKWVLEHGMVTVANAVMVGSIMIPLFMTLNVQYPVSDQLHLAYNRCLGRFELYFNPLSREQANIGIVNRKGEKYCSAIYRRVEDSLSGTMEFYLNFGWFISCKTSIYLTQIVMLGLPEVYLYFATFRHIKRHNHQTALSGIISEDTVKRRKHQNKLNIMVTFWAWIAQLITNIIYLILMNFIFAKSRFYHTLLANCTICLNFNILPLFYIIMTDDDLKNSIQNKRMFALLDFFRGKLNE